MTDDARFWNDIADSYAAKPFPNPDATSRKLAYVHARLRPTDRLLDLGCATGTLTIEHAKHVAEAVGVDVSEAMIRHAQQKAAGIDNVRFVVEPAGELTEFADASFDVVTLFNLLHLVPDPAALLRAVARVLRPGGLMVSATACLGGVWFPPYALILPVMRWMGKAPAVTRFSKAELRTMVEAAGFAGIETPEVGGDGVFLAARRV